MNTVFALAREQYEKKKQKKRKLSTGERMREGKK